MSQQNGDDRGQELSAKTISELNDIVSCLCDEVMKTSDGRRLNELLDQDPAARQYYYKLISIHSALITTAGNYAYARSDMGNIRHGVKPLSIEDLRDQAVPIAVAHSSSRPVDYIGSLWRSMRWWGTIAIAVCFVGFVALWAHRGDLHNDRAIGSNAGIVPTNVDSSPLQLVAEVTYVSPTVRWQDSNASYVIASRVGTGQSLVLAYGQVELTYTTGTKLLLTGPTEFVVDSAGGKLRRGELIARVPETGHGFTVETPNGQVIDLGTEFSVVVDDFGVSQVNVYEGKIETQPISLTDSVQKIQLTSGHALQWNGRAIIPMDATGRRYHSPGAGNFPDAQTVLPAAVSFEDDFRGEALSSQAWKSIGTVGPTGKGLQFNGPGGGTQRPYLITRREFDPAQGAIRVICDVRFVGAPDIGDDASVAILTRCADEQGKRGSPWQDMMARFVRCGFKIDSDSGEGMLEAGMKYEPDRELWNNSWGSVSRPKPETLYRLEMHDDGLNVGFTVSQVENPSIRKTINCRSLFRGNNNFIAVEGPDNATVVLERFQVFQDRPNLQFHQLADLDPRGSSKSNFDEAISSQLFTELMPRDANLVIEDDFDGREINPEFWTILGDVVLQNGQLQLGPPNEDGRIDTWKPRPYLLTKQKFDLREGALTIVGKAAFADNFLNGYGGSFAVMTRAADSHGSGPGWENSILQRGIRLNSWPAALGFEHSLQIHEKPQPNTISLLTTDGFQIDPRSRCYYFCIHDDGNSAKLTFIDTKNPQIRKSISHATTPAAPSTGHIAFESCWGSWMLLDNIRVFRSDGNAK